MKKSKFSDSQIIEALKRVEGVLGGQCPNCGGELVARPRRPPEKLAANPASTERIYKPAGCGRAASS